MGCFLGCFGGGSKKKQRTKKRLSRVTAPHGVSFPLQPTSETGHRLHLTPSPLQDPLPAPLLHPTSADAPVEPREKAVIVGGVKKKVTFNPDVKTIAEVPAADDDDVHLGFSWEEKDAKEGTGSQNRQGTPRSPCVFPPSHRYSRNSDTDDDDDDIKDEDYEDCGMDRDEYDDLLVEEGGSENEKEESYESFFSLPLHKENELTKEVNSPEPKTASPLNEVPVLSNTQSLRDRTHYVHPVLNPIQNLSQWREAKTASSLKHSNKENDVDGFNFETVPGTKKSLNFSDSKQTSKDSSKHGISVDASLSSWLGMPAASESYRSTSLMSKEDQPILGALTTEDLKHSVTSSPRQSPRKSPDEIPIVGSVGSYWNCTSQDIDTASSPYSKGIPNTTRKYSEDMKVNFHSTPFELRLERAMKKDGISAGEKLHLPLERTPDEIPVVSSVTSYWNYLSEGNGSSSRHLSSPEVKGVQNTTCKFREVIPEKEADAYLREFIQHHDFCRTKGSYGIQLPLRSG